MKGISLNTLAHPRFIALVCILRGGESLPRPASGRLQTSATFPTRLASPAHSFRPRLAPTPGSGRNESAVLFCRHMGTTSFISPRPLRPASTIRRTDRLPSALWLANGRHARAGNGQRTNASLSQSGQTRGFRCRFGTPFRIAHPVNDHLVFADRHSWRSHPAEIRFALAGSTRRHTKDRHPFCPGVQSFRGISAPCSPRPLRPSSYLRCKSG